MKYITIIAKISVFFSFKIVCSFIDLLILINFSEYNAVVWWYFRFLKQSDRYHFFLNRNMIKFANIFHKFVSFIREENDMWKIFHYKLGIFKDNFFECEKKLYLKNSRSDSTACMNQKIKCEHVWHMITLVFWFWEVFFSNATSFFFLTHFSGPLKA